MPSKRKKSPSNSSRTYSTRQIMEITEQRRLKKDAQNQSVQPQAEVPEAKPVTVADNTALRSPETSRSPIEPENKILKELLPEASVQYLSGTIIKNRIFILSLMVSLLLGVFNFPESWTVIWAAKLNGLIIYASLFVLNILQGSCRAEGLVLTTPYYKVQMQGDVVSFYSLALLVVLTLLLAVIQKTSWIKRGEVFISLIPLVVVANMLRVLWACGLAFNYGMVMADRYFYGALIYFVFIFVVSGLIIIEFLFSAS